MAGPRAVRSMRAPRVDAEMAETELPMIGPVQSVRDPCGRQRVNQENRKMGACNSGLRTVIEERKNTCMGVDRYVRPPREVEA